MSGVEYSALGYAQPLKTCGSFVLFMSYQL